MQEDKNRSRLGVSIPVETVSAESTYSEEVARDDFDGGFRFVPEGLCDCRTRL